MDRCPKAGFAVLLLNISVIRYLKKVMKHLPPNLKRNFFLLLLLMVVVALVEALVLGLISLYATSISVPEKLLTSSLFTNFIDYFGIEGPITNESLILALSILVVIAIAVKNWLLVFMNLYVGKHEARVQAFLGNKLMKMIMDVAYEWHLSRNPQEILFTINLKEQMGLFVQLSLNVASNSILTLVMLTSVFIIQPILMPAMTVVIGLASYYIYRIVRKKVDRNSQKLFSSSMASILETSKAAYGMKDVRIVGLEKKLRKSYADKNYRYAKHSSFRKVLASLPANVMETIGFIFLSLSIILMVSILQLSWLEIIGTLAVIAVGAWKVLPAINRIVSFLAQIRSIFPQIDFFFKTIDEIKQFAEQENRKKYLISSRYDDTRIELDNSPVFNNETELIDISFSYSNSKKYAIEKLTCRIRRGESIGIIGHSGAGKSTLVDILIGLLIPDTGQMKIDGVSVTPEKLSKWKRLFGYVHQFPYIYDCTLAENVALGEDLNTIDERKILQVCKRASINFIDELEDGIYSRIGERGSMLSGGQKQRITIARALYTNPEILIFDEATSSLDAKSERMIKQTIDRFKGDQTILIIAHRLSSVENCDKLIWLENGRLIKTGTPEEILPLYEKTG